MRRSIFLIFLFTQGSDDRKLDSLVGMFLFILSMIPFLKISQVSSVVAPLFAVVTVLIDVLAQSCFSCSQFAWEYL